MELTNIYTAMRLKGYTPSYILREVKIMMDDAKMRSKAYEIASSYIQGREVGGWSQSIAREIMEDAILEAAKDDTSKDILQGMVLELIHG